MKKWYTSKTLWVNVLIAAGSILLLATKEFELTEAAVGAIMFSYGVVNIVLRTITKDSLTM